MEKRSVVVATVALSLFTVMVFSSKIASAGDDAQPQDLKTVVASLRDSLKDVQQQLDQLKQAGAGVGGIHDDDPTSCSQIMVRGRGGELGSGFV